MNKVNEILKDARNLIEQGWTKGFAASYIGGKICFCSIGAIDRSHTSSEFELADSAERVLSDVINEKYKETNRWPSWVTSTGRIIKFNDHADTTKEDVLAAFDEAIKRTSEETK